MEHVIIIHFDDFVKIVDFDVGTQYYFINNYRFYKFIITFYKQNKFKKRLVSH